VITMPTPGGDDFGRAVRRLRRARRLTIEALAHGADMHPTYLSGIGRGVRNPTWVKVCALADALGVGRCACAER
jgi:transcriptional regulator with XRE-family HTH domain